MREVASPLSAQVCEQADHPLALRVALSQAVEEADLACSAVVHRRPVEDREHGVRPLDAPGVGGEDCLGGDVDPDEPLLLVGHEDVEAFRPQPCGAVVEERPLVGREYRRGEVDAHRLSLVEAG